MLTAPSSRRLVQLKVFDVSSRCHTVKTKGIQYAHGSCDKDEYPPVAKRCESSVPSTAGVSSGVYGGYCTTLGCSSGACNFGRLFFDYYFQEDEYKNNG